MSLVVGAGGGASRPTPTPTAPAVSGSSYAVQRGDTLAKIARKMGAEYNALVAANLSAHPCLGERPFPACALRPGWVLALLEKKLATLQEARSVDRVVGSLR